MDVALLEEAAANGLPRPTLEKHVVRNHYRGSTIDLQERAYVLQKVQLLVRGRGPEVLSQVAHRFGFGVALCGDDLVGRLLPERWISEHHLEVGRRGCAQGIVHGDEAVSLRVAEAVGPIMGHRSQREGILVQVLSILQQARHEVATAYIVGKVGKEMISRGVISQIRNDGAAVRIGAALLELAAVQGAKSFDQ